MVGFTWIILSNIFLKIYWKISKFRLAVSSTPWDYFIIKCGGFLANFVTLCFFPDSGKVAMLNAKIPMTIFKEGPKLTL